MTSPTRRRLTFLAGFAVFFAAVWYFWYTPFVYPLKIFVVLLHELSHAFALLLTGGTVDRITLDPAQGGATVGRGGIQFVTLSAGYLGSLVLGSLLVLGAQWRRARSGLLLAGVGAAVLILTALFVRNAFGLAFGLTCGAALLWGGRRLPVAWSTRILMGLGLTSALYAILDIKSDILDRPELQSDAAMLAELTGIPTLWWGVAWIALAVLASALLLRSVWRNA
jgi:Peptidase M50B-like